MVLAGVGLELASKHQSPPNQKPNSCAGGVPIQPLHMATLASPPQLVLVFPALVLASLASTGNCTLHSPISHLSMGESARHLPAACSVPAPMGRPKASSMCPVKKVHAGRPQWGLGGLDPASSTAMTLFAGPRARLSATFGFNPCVNAGCGKPAVRPLVDTGAMVFVVFGIVGINRTRQVDNHVIGDPVRGPALSRCQLTRLANKYQPEGHPPSPRHAITRPNSFPTGT